MIECSNNNIWYKRKKNIKSGKRRRFSALFLILVIFSIVFLYYKFFISNQILKLCEEYSYSYSTDSVNKAVLISTDSDSTYNELVSVTKNNLGEIELITLNSQKINKMNREIAQNTNKILTDKLNGGVNIPLLAFSGIGLLKGYGPSVNFKTIYVTSVVCDFKGKFESVGINQTRHSLYISVISKVKVDMFFSSKTVDCITDVLISEAVLVGKVPEIYLK